MPTVTVPREVTSDEVVKALRDGLNPSYEVQPGTKMPRSPFFGRPRPAGPELIMVSSGMMTRAQVTVVPRPGGTDLKVTPGGVLSDLLMNTLGIARRVREVLQSDPALNERPAPQ